MTDVHVVLACGLAELATVRGAVAALGLRPAKTVLVMYGRAISMPRFHREDTLRHVAVFGPWDMVIDACDFSDEAYNGDLEAARAALGADVNVLGEASVVFTHTLWKPFERMLLRLMPNAQLVLFDNGLDSHNARAVADTPHSKKSNVIDTRDLDRVALGFYSLGDLLCIPDHASKCPIAIPTGEDLAKVYREVMFGGCAEVLRSVVPQIGLPLHLSIGTSFNRLPQIAFEDEAEVYCQLASWARSSGCEVLFKDHPRSHASISETIGVADHVWRSSLPVELVCAGPWEIATAASISSTALLTLRKAFGTEVRLVGTHLRRRLNLAWNAELESLLGDDITLARAR